MVDYLSHLTAMEGLHMVDNTTVHPVLNERLLFVAPYLDLDSCIISGVATLRASSLT